MTLKNNYNFNGTFAVDVAIAKDPKKVTKNQKFLGSLKQSKTTFSVNLLKKNLLNLRARNLNIKLDGAVGLPPIGETTTLNTDRNKQIWSSTGLSKTQFLKSNWSHFVYTKRITNTKQIQTRFRSIISDQKRRIRFDNQELRKVLLKSLLCVTSSLPTLQLEVDSLAKLKKASIGPGLILEHSINRQYTKKQGISNIRNRCMVTGRSSIIGKFRLSRISFRRYAGQGLIPGLVKGSH